MDKIIKSFRILEKKECVCHSFYVRGVPAEGNKKPAKKSPTEDASPNRIVQQNDPFTSPHPFPISPYNFPDTTSTSRNVKYFLGPKNTKLSKLVYSATSAQQTIFLYFKDIHCSKKYRGKLFKF